MFLSKRSDGRVRVKGGDKLTGRACGGGGTALSEAACLGYSVEYHHSRNLKKKMERGRRYLSESMTAATVSTRGRSRPKLSPRRCLASPNSFSNSFYQRGQEEDGIYLSAALSDRHLESYIVSRGSISEFLSRDVLEGAVVLCDIVDISDLVRQEDPLVELVEKRIPFNEG